MDSQWCVRVLDERVNNSRSAEIDAPPINQRSRRSADDNLLPPVVSCLATVRTSATQFWIFFAGLFMVLNYLWIVVSSNVSATKGRSQNWIWEHFSRAKFKRKVFLRLKDAFCQMYE